jgi:amino acid adenylation domain-containing protein
MPDSSGSTVALSPAKQALLARRLQRAGTSGPTVRPRQPGQAPPLSSGQESLWFLDRLVPGSTAYSISSGWRLSGDLDRPALAQALRAVTGRHEALRMRFPAGPDGAPVMLIDDQSRVELTLIDLASLRSDGSSLLRSTSAAAEVAAEPFDLAAGPLIRSALIRIADDDHVLVLVLHHIIADGWSVEILAREIWAVYGQLTRGDAPELPDLPIQFGDFAAWEAERLSSPVLESGLSYWRDQLADLPALQLTAASQRPPEQTFDGALHEFELEPGLAAAAADLARRSGATVYMTLMAAFQALLARQTGQYDFAVGSPIAGRQYRELEGVVGSFVNTLAIRARLGGDPSFTQILARCRSTVLDGLSHQDIPFDHIIRDLKVQREAGQSGIFQVTFTLDNLTGNADSASWIKSPVAGLTVGEFAIPRRVTQFDLALYASERPDGGISCYFTYRPDVFESAEVERLGARLKVLLRAAAGQPDLRLSELPAMTAPEREQVLGSWPGRAAVQVQQPGPLHALFEAQVALTPLAPALVMDGRSLTYAELDSRANRLARRLQRLGVGPDVRVAVCLPPSLDLAVAIVAVLKAGGAYLPLDPDQPRERLTYSLDDAQVRVLLTAHWRPGAYDGYVIDLDEEAAGLSAESAEPLAPSSEPADLAYVIYTSGTTGKPKGVAVEHGAIVRYLNSIHEVLQVEPGAAYALLQSLAFDFSILMFYLPLMSGGCLHLLPRNIAGEDLADAISRLGIDYLKMTPSHLAALSSETEIGRLLPRRALVLAGEALPADFGRRLAAEQRCAIFNSYGPTETVVAVTTYQIGPEPRAQRAASAPIGRPMLGVRAMVLDDHLRPVAPGVPGELYVGGSRLARGYLNHPALTAERFVADPFGEPGARLYRTGDRVRWLADGLLEFLGRSDHQVKIRGYRVELGEIESALTRLDRVAQAVVDLRGNPGHEYLAAYLRMAGSSSLMTTADIRSELATWLPEYMIPARYLQVDAFPRQAHGKIDRSKLPEPDSEQSGAAAGFCAPRDEVERTIAGVWTEILELDTGPSIYDNFFDLGGHSLLATRVVARLRKEFREMSEPIRVMDMLASPYIADLAVLVKQAEAPAVSRLLYELTPPIQDNQRVLSIVCAPYGGASASVYKELAAELPAGHSLFSIQVPGRDLGRAEEHLSVDQVADSCTQEILGTVSGPLVLYGHCGPGGALAVALAQRLADAGREFEALYLGGVFPFARPAGRLLGPLSRLVEMDRFRADRSDANWLRGMGADMSGLDAEATRSMIRAMRKDGVLAEAYFTELLARGARKLNVPVISVVGERDPASLFYQERYTEWEFLSDVAGLVVIREAGHFFVRHRAAELAEIVTITHRAMLAGPGDVLSRASRGPDPTWWLEECSTGGTGTPPGPERAVGTGSDSRRPNEGRPETMARQQGMSRFSAIASSQLISIIGSTLTEFAIPLWIYLKTGSLSYFGLLAVVGLLPGVAVAPVAGAIVDRHDRRRVMIAGDVAACSVEAVLLVLAWINRLQVWNIALLVGAISVALTFQRTAYISAIPQIVPKRFLGHANGIFQAANGFAQFAAPLIGVGLLAAVGLRNILSLDVASYIAAIGVVVLMRFPEAMAAQRVESVMTEIRQGLKYILERPGFRALLIWFTLLNLCVAPAVVLSAPLVLSISSLPAVAAIAAAGGIGAVVGGLTMSVWGGPRFQRMRGVRVLVPVLAFFVALTGFRPELVLVGIGMLGVNFCLGLINGIVLTINQTKVPQRLQGRFFALSVLIVSLALPVAFGVVAPYGPRVLRPLTFAHGVVGDIVRATTGSGHGRPIALVYIFCAIGLVLLAAGTARIHRLTRFDIEMEDAIADDLLGIQAIRDAGVPGPARKEKVL